MHSLPTPTWVTAGLILTPLTVITLPQKWSKGKVREKVANKVLFEEDLYARFNAEVPKVRRPG